MKFDEVELQKFIDILPDLQDDEVFFISLAARKKYLSIEEQKEINLNHAEMFNRMIIRSKEKFFRIVERLSGSGYCTKNGTSYPEKCLVAYFNVNPTSMISAYLEFSSNMNKYLVDLAKSSKPMQEHSMTKLRKLDTELMNSVQRQRSKKNFIDIDVDTKDHTILEGIVDELKSNNVTYHVVSTHGGFHLLLKRDTIKFNYTELVARYDKLSDKEVIVNKNAMIPLPGTMQGNHLVKILS